MWVEATRPDGTIERSEIAALDRDMTSAKVDGLGLRLTEAKNLLQGRQSYLSQDQVWQLSAAERICRSCGVQRALHDYRSRQVDTLFDRVKLRQPRWRPCACAQTYATNASGKAGHQSQTSVLIGVRATPELIRVEAELGARLSFREATRVMNLLLPSNTAAKHTGVRRRLAQTADSLQVLDVTSPHRMSRAKAGPIVVSIDGGHVRAVPCCQVCHGDGWSGGN